MIGVVFRLPRDGDRRVAVAAGTSLLDASHQAAIPIEGACGGNMACATCHVYVDHEWYAELPGPSPEEEDMLDLASDWRPTSRLGCQIKLDETLDGLIVAVPPSSLLDD